MIIITGFKDKVEKSIGCEISNIELIRAIESAKNDVVANNLICGKDVTCEQFIKTVAESIRITRGA